MARFCARALLLVVSGAAFGSLFAADLQTPKAVIPSSYFGLHIHHLLSANPTPWPNIPVPQWRLWDANVTWPDIEPSRDQYRFENLDSYVSFAEQHRTGILLPLGGTPRWASSHPDAPSPYYPGFTAAPLNNEDWRNFVRTVAVRYKGRIEAYEIWNEPNLQQFWSGTTDQMLELTKEAYQIIHSVDPNALVVSPSATADYGVPWTEEFLKKGGAQYVDVVGFHFYVNPHERPPEDLLPLIQRVRKVLADNGAKNKPIWNTETGWLPPAKFDSEELAAGVLARAYLLSWAAGIDRFYWYAWDNYSLSIVTYNVTQKKITPAGTGYKVIEEWLTGARLDSCTDSAEHVWVCQLNRSGKKEWIVWNPQGSSKFTVPLEWHAKSSTGLLQAERPIEGTSIEVGPVPTLLAGGRDARRPRRSPSQLQERSR
jgi:glycosyl hydrolase family 39 (putative alpha-L-iduronidase)